MSESKIVSPEEWADSVVYVWRNQGLRLREGATVFEFAQNEERLGYSFDPYFKALYSRTNGFADEDLLGCLIVLWPLSEFVREPSTHAFGDFIIFGDYMIRSAEYCFMAGETGVFKLYDLDGAAPERVASSFLEFVTLVNQDHMLVY